MDSSQSPQENKKKLYVGNLSWNLKEEDLRELFAEHGEVTEVNLITEPHSGRSKGFAFVEFATEEAAQAAVEALNETEIDGRKIFVNIARPKQPREDRGGYHGSRDNGFNRRGGSDRGFRGGSDRRGGGHGHRG